jgi:hypothetical protein
MRFATIIAPMLLGFALAAPAAKSGIAEEKRVSKSLTE